jgi:hypothetical protein
MSGRLATLFRRLPVVVVVSCLATWLCGGQAAEAFLGTPRLETLHVSGAGLIEVAKKRKRRATKSSASTAEDPSQQSALVPGPNDHLLAGATADVLIKVLTPSTNYRVGQSVFLELVVGRRKGTRGKAAIVKLTGDGIDLVMTVPKGIASEKIENGTSLTFLLGGGSRQTVLIEARLADTADVSSRSLVSQLHIAVSDEKAAAPAVLEALSFPVTDCATAYHRALGGIYAAREPVFAGIVKSASLADEALPGTWVFPPRKAANVDARPKRTVLSPPRRECRWFVETVDFSSRKSTRLCKKWEVIEVWAAPAGPTIPEVDEERAAAVVKAATAVVESRAAVSAFAKPGRLNWISNRILADLKAYMRQEPHPALCNGIDIMTAYMVDNSTTLRKELTASAATLREARQIASMRLEVLRMVLGKDPEEPAETASLSLITPAHAAPQDDSDGRRLVAEAARLLLRDAERPGIAAAGSAMASLRQLAVRLGVPTEPARSAGQATYLADALTAIEAAVYLEASEVRYRAVGEAIFGSISAIEKAHGETCSCAP